MTSSHLSFFSSTNLQILKYMMRPLVASIFDISPWQRIKAELFPNKKDSKEIKDKIELQANIVADLNEIWRNNESSNDDGFLSSSDVPFKKVIVKGKNTKLWRVYFFGPRDSYVAFPLPYEHTICVQKILNGSNGMFYINDVYCNHRLVFELKEEASELMYIRQWIYDSTNYGSGAYNAFLSDDGPIYYKITKE